jgi:hypothetical protein
VRGSGNRCAALGSGIIGRWPIMCQVPDELLPSPGAATRVTARPGRRWQAERRWLLGDLGTTAGVVALVGGAVAEWLAWQAFVPWDMSEVDKVGRVIEPGRGDHLWPQIFAALAVVTVAYIAIGFVWGRRLVVAASVGSAATWAFIWSWRASVSRVVGANFWLSTLVILVVPAAIAGVLLVRAAVRANELLRARRRPPRT